MRSQDLHVIMVFQNHKNWHNRYRLLYKSVAHMKQQGVSLTLVEHVTGERPFAYPEGDPRIEGVNYLKIRGVPEHEMWLKEGLLKYGAARLPADAKYLALVDADVFFQRMDWAVAVINALQCHRVVWPWSYSVDLDQNENPIADENGRTMDRSFGAAWVAGDVRVVPEDYGLGQPSPTWLLNDKVKDRRQHYGYAIAMRRETWNAIGGLPDWLVTGSADYIAAMAFSGKLSVSDTYNSPGARRRLTQFAKLCDQHVRQDIGVVPGLLTHGFHGSKVKRFYLTRKDIVKESGFDPDVDIGYDIHGLPYLCSDNRILRDGLRRLSAARDEDSSISGF